MRHNIRFVLIVTTLLLITGFGTAQQFVHPGIDMNQAKLSRIEGMRIAITDRDLIAIAKCLGVTLDELCKQDNDTSEC